jgi:asparagine synthase (glutamine-hydrolysing)
MCGICGKVMFDREARVPAGLLKSMADAIVHRGPDDEGYHLEGPVGLGFRRLSIIDLQTGHQPLSNEDGTVWVTFNGEIYNYEELRNELLARNHVFRTKTDTEVLVHLYEDYGPEMLEKLRGMFAFSIWDRKNQVLLLARDRLGIKPLYYYKSDGFLSFGSEIKSILEDPAVVRQVDAGMIDRFLTYHYLPGQETLFRNISKLMPGHYLLVRSGQVHVKQYWDVSFAGSDREWDERTAANELQELLDECIRLHMISDVPVGFLLSGGVDSTAMLGLAVDRTDKAISSYTVGFSDGVVDERPYARLAAKTFGSEHHEITISSRDFAGFLTKYIWHMEEPVCEPPAIALYYVSKAARDYVKVLISGEGGDETFAGYSNYRNFSWLESAKSILGPACRLAGTLVSGLNSISNSPRLQRYAPLFDAPLEGFYLSRTSTPFSFFNRHAEDLYTRDFLAAICKQRSVAPTQALMRNAASYKPLEKMLYVDTKTWLPDDLLVKADKMTMANSVELRVPLLDHKFVEFAAKLPGNFKIRGRSTKYLLKKVLRSRVPDRILKRPKAGFPVPYEDWLRKDLNGWLQDVLLERDALSRGYFKRECVERLILDNRARGAYSKELFCLVVLELWHRVFLCRDKDTFALPTGIPQAVRAIKAISLDSER